MVARNIAVKTAVQNNDILAATTGKGGSVNVVDNALLVSVNGNKVADHGISNGMTYNKTTVASFNNNFNNSTGVANINIASGNLNIQKTYYSGSLPSELLASGGSANLTALYANRFGMSMTDKIFCWFSYAPSTGGLHRMMAELSS